MMISENRGILSERITFFIRVDFYKFTQSKIRAHLLFPKLSIAW